MFRLQERERAAGGKTPEKPELSVAYNVRKFVAMDSSAPELYTAWMSHRYLSELALIALRTTLLLNS